jgi:hypothetical protein
VRHLVHLEGELVLQCFEPKHWLLV